MNQGKGPFVDLCKVKKYTKLLTRTRLWTWNTQKEVSVEITSTYEDLRRIWWAIAQGNISFLYLTMFGQISLYSCTLDWDL